MEIRDLCRDEMSAPEAAELARLLTLVSPRRHQSDPPMTATQANDSLRPSQRTYSCAYSGLFDGDTMVGFAEATGAINAENSDVAELGIWIDPSRLGAGLEHTVYEHVSATERQRGRTRFFGWGLAGNESTRAFWEDDMGYELAYDERLSRCVLAEVDPQLMQQWIDQAAERAAGYRLVFGMSPLPDELLVYLAAGLEAMNDAPVDSLDIEHEAYDPERAREIEQIFDRDQFRFIFAIDDATGDLAGYTSVRLPNADPTHSKQGDTVTVAAHRNRGIGRWLKAAMWKSLRTERPEVEVLDTGNAESNRAMLNINEAMGFQDILHHSMWHKPSGPN